MKQGNQVLGNLPGSSSSPEYPDVLVPEEPEEDNPTAYTLLSEIKDPYYTKIEQKGRSTSSVQEGMSRF
jgi:hypothetical protein